MLLPEVLPNQFEESAEVEAADIFMWLLTRLRRDRGAVDTVGEHFREQHSVQFYADKLCITPNYLNEILSSAININAKQYILNKVTDEAQRLLTYTDLPISEIASELHFSTVSYFVRSFRQCIGYTPLAYRKMEKP